MKDNLRASRTFAGINLLQIAMPMGGIGAGCICLSGSGGLQDFSIRHRPSTTELPDNWEGRESAFALLHIKGEQPITRLLEGPLPPEKIYAQSLQAQGYRKGGHEGLPRFERVHFENEYPFGRVHLEDESVPLRATVTGWSPFIPLDDVNSGLPCAIMEYTLENRSHVSVDFEFSFHLSHLAEAPESKTFNTPIQSEFGGGIHFTNDAASDAEEKGSAALFLAGYAPQIKAMWFRGGWFDAMSVLWREVSTGTFQENDGKAEVHSGRNGGSLLISHTLRAGESITFPVVLAWHFPNSNQRYGEVPREESDNSPQSTPAWQPFYAGVCQDAQEVALAVASRLDSLRERTRQFAEALWNSTLPSEVVDAVASNLAILKSPTILRQKNGNLWAWEGCFTERGSCHGSCTHVWNYAQALPHLFPALERTLREQELQRSMDERGHIHFRAALPDGPTPHDFHAAADGQLGGILKLWRDFHICGNREWLQTMFPLAKRSLDYCIETWDPKRRGALFEPHHNTYDIEFWGPDAMCGTIYVAALAALADLACEVGEDGQLYRELSERGAKFLEEELFNGEYHFQKVQWEGLRDVSLVESISKDGEESDALTRLERAEGPKYQYGTGCLSDGVIGAWMAQLYGIETPLDRDHVRSTLRAIVKHNFKADLAQHVCLQRPGYAMGHEAGLLVCTWPRGGKPTLPFVYSDEVWTGIEYQVASHLILEGMVEEGLTLVRAARSRYDGHVRNPFNEYECGSYYARALASYALLPALSGFRYDADSQTLHFGPKIGFDGEFRTFFSTASGFGTIRMTEQALTVELIEGTLEITTLSLTLEGSRRERPWAISIGSGQKMLLPLD